MWADDGNSQIILPTLNFFVCVLDLTERLNLSWKTLEKSEVPGHLEESMGSAVDRNKLQSRRA